MCVVCMYVRSDTSTVHVLITHAHNTIDIVKIQQQKERVFEAQADPEEVGINTSQDSIFL